ncbi:MAG: hypothetical protein JNJ59_28260 [Deltaproteobacteria bacterium]|nr:hypothetical protein [Deltaproteobacteria bacterium]
MGRVQREVEQAGSLVVEAHNVNGAAAKEAEALLAQARTLQAAITSSFWDLGRVLGVLAERKLHLALGFSRFDQLVEARLGLSKTLAWRLITVAGRLPKKEAMKLGQERAHALVAFAAASNGEIDPVEVARLDQPLVGDRPLSETPVREILAARPRRPTPLAQRADKAIDKKLAAAVKRRATALGLRVAEVEVRSDRVLIALTRSQAERLARD